MRNIIICVLMVFSIFLSSCKEKHQCPEQIQYRIWDGQNFSLKENYPLPVCIIWQKYAIGWDEYKSFSQGVEISHIVDLLDSPEIKDSKPQLRTKNKLTLFFPFDINHTIMFPVLPVKIVELWYCQ